MRVLHVFQPPDGGVPEHVATLVPALCALDCQAVVAGPAEAAVYGDIEPVAPIVRLQFEDGFGAPVSDARVLARLVRLIRSERPDLVHAHSVKAGALARVAARVGGTPLVYSPHSFPFTGDFGRARLAASRAVERRLAPWTSAFVCVSEHERRIALDFGLPAAKLELVRHGVPACPRVEPDRDLTRWAAGRRVVAAVAAFRHQKGLDLLVRSAPAILAAAPDACVALVGGGRLEPQLRALAAALRLPADRFRIFPFTRPSGRYLQSIDLLVMPSRWEAFPIAAIEALACGVPHVATDVGGLDEAVVDGVTGTLVPPEDPRALAEAAIALMASPPTLRAMSVAARKRHDEMFAVERMAAETAAVYETVLAPAPRG